MPRTAKRVDGDDPAAADLEIAHHPDPDRGLLPQAAQLVLERVRRPPHAFELTVEGGELRAESRAAAHSHAVSSASRSTSQ